MHENSKGSRLLTTWIGKIANQPLAIFVIGAGCIFLWDAATPAGSESEPIQISEAQTDRLVSDFKRRLDREPSPEEVTALQSDWIDQEVYYRQALALELDDDDPVIRRYLINKMKYLSQDSIVVPSATESDLIAYYEEVASSLETADITWKAPTVERRSWIRKPKPLRSSLRVTGGSLIAGC